MKNHIKHMKNYLADAMKHKGAFKFTYQLILDAYGFTLAVVAKPSGLEAIVRSDGFTIADEGFKKVMGQLIPDSYKGIPVTCTYKGHIKK